VIAICLLAFVALVLLGSIGAFFLCCPILPIALVAVILLGMAFLFLLGFWAGASRVLELSPDQEGFRRLRRVRVTAESGNWLATKDGGRLEPSLGAAVLIQGRQSPP
jgi:hypothetical protein